MFQDKVGFHFGKKLVHHRRLLSLGAGRGSALLLQHLDSFGQNELAVQALGCDETDLTGLRKALIQTLEGNTQAVADPIVVEVAESNGLLTGRQLRRIGRGVDTLAEQRIKTALMQSGLPQILSVGVLQLADADTEGLNFRKAFSDAGFYLSGCCIWKKPSLVLGRSPYQWQHEPCLYGWKKSGKHQWYADRKQTTIWEFEKTKKNTDHPTMKPIPLLAYPIQNSSMSNTLILDPFGGSGSTLIACEQTDRDCYTIELDEKYCDVIVKRYIEQVGSADSVSVERDGKTYTFAELEVSDE